MEDKNKKFIITDSEETADTLIRANFRLMNHDGRFWTFLNEPQKMTFQHLGNAFYTNKISI